SQFASELAVQITKDPYEKKFSTDILLFVLRKSNRWLDFQKFTLTMRRRFDSNILTHCSIKSQIFEVPVKHRENRYVLFCSTKQHDLREILRDSSTKSFAELFQKRPFFLLN
ncbi:MAG: hypothetical protein J6S23_03355, partial [Clostridia bacterium]|nr:hypothetical protein [Clostridia bacterium]